MKLKNCPAYIWEWMKREKDEERERRARKIEQRAQMMLQYVQFGEGREKQQPVIGQSQAPGDNGFIP